MTHLLTTLYFISAAMLCVATGYAVVLAQGGGAKMAYRAWAMICLCFSCAQVFTAIQYESIALPDVIAAHKWLNLFSILVFPLASWLIGALEGAEAQRWVPLLLSAASVPLIIDNFMAPYGYRFARLAPDLRSVLPWGEDLSILSGVPSDAQMLMQLLVFGVGIQLALFTRRLHRQHQILSSRIAWVSVLLLLLTTVLSKYSDVGTLRMPYLGGFAFSLLAAVYLLLVRPQSASRITAAQRMRSMLEQEIERHGQSLERIKSMLHQDPLTCLYNRAGLLLELERSGVQGGAMLALELDRFDVIGGTSGDGTRDQLTIAAAKRILHLLGPADILARVGNSRFAIFYGQATSVEQAAALYGQLSTAFLLPFPIAEAPVMSLSAGIVLALQAGASPGHLLEAAEMALHEAHSSGGNKYRVYRPELEQTLRAEAAFENALMVALEKNQFSLSYQPQVSAQDERPMCVEALLRWQHPEHGFIEPGKFIAVAESMGIIGRLGAWVIDSACQQLADLRAAGHGTIRIAINVSTQQLMLPDLQQHLYDSIRRFDLDPAAIELEVTESLVMRMPELAIARLQALRDMGMRLAIDDFGTGYSSLTYLQMLPVHALKLDRSFIPGIDNSARALSICRNAIQMGRDLGLEVVAEGIETAAQAQALRELGCNLLQGYHYAKPLSPEELLTYLARWPLAAAVPHAATSLPD